MTVRGLNYALQILEQIPAEFKGRNSIVDRELKKLARKGRDAVRIKTPVKTGRLRNAVATLRTSAEGESLKTAVLVRPGKSRKDKRGAFYRLIVEKRQPFFRPAIRAFAIDSLQSFPDSLSSAAERLQRRYNRSLGT